VKRHAGLHDLSRDHHLLLLHARRLRGEDPRVDLATARRRFLLFAAATRQHFEEEERALLPLVRDAGLRERVLREHADLRERIARLPQEGDLFQRDLGDRLRAHVRFEEDVLFEAMQRGLSAQEWMQVAAVAGGYRASVRPNSIGPGAGEECFLD
jgi:hemerythrin-like domain-containing protein